MSHAMLHHDTVASVSAVPELEEATVVDIHSHGGRNRVSDSGL
jgi:hypothetical protein